MKQKRNNFFRNPCALLVSLWLAAGFLADADDQPGRFPNPLPAEQFVLANLLNPGFIDLAANTGLPPTVASRTISGQFLEWLLTKNVAQLSHAGLRLKNAVIEGPVDLSNEEVPAQIWLQCCHFKTNVILAGAHFDYDLTFEGCLFDGDFVASALRVDGSLALKACDLNLAWKTRDAITPPNVADLENCLATNQTIQTWSPENGEFILETNQLTRKWFIKDWRKFEATNRSANNFIASAWGGALFVVQEYEDIPAQAHNFLMGLTFGPFTNQWQTLAGAGALDLDSVRSALATALQTNSLYVADQLMTSNATNWPVSIGWSFDNPKNPEALPLAANWNRGIPSVSFCQHTVFRKSVALDRAVIAGKLDGGIGEVEFRGDLYAHSLKVGYDLVMMAARCDGFTRFIYAQIGHDFQVSQSVFQQFDASGMNVGGSLLLEKARFRSNVSFQEASIGMDFKASEVRFEEGNTPDNFSGLTVAGMADFQQAQFKGPANFILAHVKGNFQAPGAAFEDQRSFKELQKLTGNSFTFNTDFGSMQVDGFAIFENALFARSVSFRNARFANLYLDGTHWPDDRILMTYTNDPKPKELLRLEGMDFETIRDVASSHFLHTAAQLEESQTNLLRMFARRSPYSFDIYSKLESYFQRQGAPGLADGVFVSAKQREGKEATKLADKLANAFLRWTVGYGRNPLLAFGESFGCIVFWGALCQRCMIRKTPPKRRPHFGLALFFSLNTFLPIIDLGAGGLLEYRTGREWFHYLIALEKILGFILVPLWTMALTGLIK